ANPITRQPHHGGPHSWGPSETAILWTCYHHIPPRLCCGPLPGRRARPLRHDRHRDEHLSGAFRNPTRDRDPDTRSALAVTHKTYRMRFVIVFGDPAQAPLADE